MPDNARCWVYQSDREFTPVEVEELKVELTSFINGWTAHGSELDAAFSILYNHFIVLAVDERSADASGCSIDKSVAFMKGIEKKYGISLFDRMQTSYRTDSGLASCSYMNFEKLAKEGAVTPTTIVFNNMVSTINEFRTKWEVPVSSSWHNRAFN